MKNARKFKISLIAILITFVIGASAWILYNSSYFQSPILIIPASNWEKIFFKDIDETTDLAKVTKLREKNISKDDLEIRIWEGFGWEELEGVIFTRTDEIWRAYYVRNNHSAEPASAHSIQLYNVPRSGWEVFTKTIFDAEVLTLPDAISIGCEVYNLDGRSYVVEIYKDKIYRTYMYSENSDEKCDEGKQMIKIARLIAKEFYNGAQNCAGLDWLSCENIKEE